MVYFDNFFGMIGNRNDILKKTKHDWIQEERKTFKKINTSRKFAISSSPYERIKNTLPDTSKNITDDHNIMDQKEFSLGRSVIIILPH